MKRFFAVILTAAIVVTMLAVPVFAAGGSILESVPAQGGNSAYSVWDFAKASNAQTAVSSPDVYQPLDDSALSASQGGVTIKSEASDSNNGVSIMDVPEGSFWAKIVYKFDSVSLTSDAPGDTEGSASIISGSTIVDFAKFSVSNGEKVASVANAAGKSVELGKFTSSVVKLDDVKDYMTVSPTYFDGELADSSFTIACIAFFGTEEAANAYDPSVESVSVESVSAEIDIFKHTASAQFIEGVSEEEMALSPESYMFELTHMGVSATAREDAAEVTKGSKGVTAVMHFDITSIDGTVNEWTVTVTSPNSPATDANGITPYEIIDSTKIEDIVSGDGGNTFSKEVVSDGGKDVIMLSNSNKGYFSLKVDREAIKQLPSGTKWYIKTKYRFSEDTTFDESEDSRIVKYEYCGNDWTALKTDFSKEYTFSTHSSTSKGTNDLYVLFQGFGANTAKLYIDYIAIFTSASDAADYDENVVYGGEKINGIKPAYVINAKDAATGAFGAKEPSKATVDTVMDGNKKVIHAKSIQEGCNYTHFKELQSDIGAPMDKGTVYYVKMKYKLGANAEAVGTPGVQLEYGDNDWSLVSIADKFEEAKQGWVYWTKKITISKSTEFEMNIQSVKQGTDIYIDYIAFFTNEQDFNDYELSTSPKVTYNGISADVKRDSKTVELTLDPQTSADDIKAMTFEIENGDVFSFSGDWAESTEGKYLVMKKTLVDSTDSANTWTLVARSRNQYEVLGLLDCTDSANDSRFKGAYSQTNVGRHTLGNNSVLYFEDNGKKDYETYVTVDLSGIIDITTTPLYIKIAYRVEDVTEKVDGKSLFLRTAYNSKNWEDVAVIPGSNIDSYQGHWTTTIHKMKNVTTKTDDLLALATVFAKTKLSIKYIAFFETEADAKHFTFGDADAQIASDGSKVTATFDNIEDLGSSDAYLALYKDNKLVDVVSSATAETLTSGSLDAGTYTAKAFVIGSSDLKPKMKAVSDEITIQ